MSRKANSSGKWVGYLGTIKQSHVLFNWTIGTAWLSSAFIEDRRWSDIISKKRSLLAGTLIRILPEGYMW